jgi:hypothetical protein
MKNGYYTDSQGRCLGYWELAEKPENTAEYIWIESSDRPVIYIERTRQMILAEIKELESKIYYSQLDGETEWVATKMAQRASLKAELQGL